MRVYADTSALIKRVTVENESDDVRRLVVRAASSGDLLATSALTRLEAWRALRRLEVADVQGAASIVLGGIAVQPVTPDLLARARTVGPTALRSLDAVHLASALTLGAEAMVVYDERLAAAAEIVGITVIRPGR